MPTPKIGEPAPEITLDGWADGAKQSFRLSEQRGQPVVLAFYPGDETPVCTRQMCAYQDDLGMLRDLGARVWGISSQDLASHQRFADKRGLTFPLLADTEKIAQQAYGVVGPFGMTKRSVFVIDRAGAVRWAHVARLGLTYQDSDTIAGVLRELPAA